MTDTGANSGANSEAPRRGSDVRGEGFGSDHRWKRGLTVAAMSTRELKGTLYVCESCGFRFAHRYGMIIDIFDAMRAWPVPERCTRAFERS